MALFIAYMFNFHYAPSTVTTYISALGYSHKLLGFPDPSKVFYVSQILKGYKKVGFRLDSRLPITLPILDRLVSIAPFLQGSRWGSLHGRLPHFVVTVTIFVSQVSSSK